MRDGLKSWLNIWINDMSKLFAIIATILVITVLIVEYGKYVSDNQAEVAIEQERTKQLNEVQQQTLDAYLLGKYSE